MVKAVCNTCGTEFIKKANVQKFCSAECRKALEPSRSGPLREITCKGCSTVFTSTHGQQEFCTPQCRVGFFNARRFNSKRTDFRKCVICDKEFQPLQTRGPGRSTCSDACAALKGNQPKWVAKFIAGVETDPEVLAKARRWRHENNLKKTYGLTVAQFDEMFERQGGVCAICKKPESAKSNVRVEVRRLAVDHCHATGKIRGLLCTRCNTSIGQMYEDPSIFQSAVEYLKHHSENANEVPQVEHQHPD